MKVQNAKIDISKNTPVSENLIGISELEQRTEFSSAMIRVLVSRGLVNAVKQDRKLGFSEESVARLDEISDLLYSGLTLDEIARFYGSGKAHLDSHDDLFTSE